LIRKAIIQQAETAQRSPSVDFINPFIEATVHVFQTVAAMPIRRQGVLVRPDTVCLGDISGIMGLSGGTSGCVAISLPQELALLVVSRMLQTPPEPELSQETCDAIGEVVNMIAGHAKALLTRTHYRFRLGIPTVAVGRHHEITSRQGLPHLVVLFEAEEHSLALQLALTRERPTPTATVPGKALAVT
jgi:chemotaxis protein CheX